MSESDGVPLAWAESPLQLIGAAEWAASRGLRIPLAFRSTPQMIDTVNELVARDAPFSFASEWLGIPWRELARRRHWLVGDGFSGQFRMAAAVLRPRRLTFLDDGANTPALVDALTGRAPYRRPGIAERGLIVRVAPLALDHAMRRAHAGAVEVFTAYDLGAARLEALADLGANARRHTFEWTRRTAPATDLTGRVILGSALAVDGRMPLDDYLAWVEAAATAKGPVVYLPHRRETPAQLDAVARIAGVRVRETGLPAELVLAGAHDLDIVTLSPTTVTTIPLVLAGTGSAMRTVAAGGGATA